MNKINNKLKSNTKRLKSGRIITREQDSLRQNSGLKEGLEQECQRKKMIKTTTKRPSNINQ